MRPLAAVVGFALVLAACGKAAGTPPDAGATGSLAILVAGLPAGGAAVVSVTGPAAFSATVSGASQTLGSLAPGAYQLVAAAITEGKYDFAPTPVTQTVAVSAGAVATATIQYSATTGALEISVTGLASGPARPIGVTGPNGFQQTIGDGQLLSRLAPGTYQATAAAAKIGGLTYQGSPSTQSAPVTAGATASATIAYAPITGALAVAVTGLPGGVAASVVVTSAAGFSATIIAAMTLNDLAPGTYQLAASTVSSGGLAYAPSPASQAVSVVAGQVANASVGYGLGNGSLAVDISGLPTGAAASVQVTGPAGFAAALTASQVLAGLAPATYQVAAGTVTVGGFNYTPSAATQTVAVPAGGAATASVVYAVADGALVINVSGVPGGATPSLQVAGPGGYSNSLSVSTTLSHLAPGSYVVNPGSFVSSGYGFSAGPAQTATVGAGATATLSFGYAASTGSLAVSISGLPSATAAAVQVSGPGAFNASLTGSQSLTSLAPGSYQLTTSAVVALPYDYLATAAVQTVLVSAGSTAPASVAYAATTGALAVSISGVPSGAVPAVAVTGPGAFSASVSASQTLSRLVPGTYQVAAANFTFGGFTYAATATVQAPVKAGSTAPAPIAYAATDGSLSVDMTSAVTPSSPSVAVTGPGGYSTTLAASKLLSNLVPGTYQVAASDFASGNYDYSASPANQSVAVSAGATASAPLVYGATTGALGVGISGLPTGVSASVQVSGPASYAASLTASQTLAHLAPGTYQVTAANVINGTSTYLAAPVGQSLAVSGGATKSSAVGYSLQGASGSAGCGLTGKQVGDFHLSTTDGNGTTRDYEVMVPAGYNPNTPLALTLVYHGAGGNQAGAKAFGVQGAPGASTTSIFVFPQGISYQTYGVGWDDSCTGYDMPLFDHILTTIEANYCIDTGKVFVGGFSWGGDHVTALACCRGNKIRGVAAASCTDEFANAADYRTYSDLPCPAATFPGIRFTHDVNSDGAYTQQQFNSTSALYRSWGGCSNSSSPTSPSPCVAWGTCTQPVVECAYSGLGHAIPSGWGNDTWAFFSSFQ